MPVSVKIKRADIDRLEMVRHLILEDITRHYSIAHLSHVSSLNEFKLKVGFKMLFQKGIYEYLQHHRMEHALHLLNTSEENIKVIARKCGYGYAANFTAVFRRKFKIKPTDYRKSQTTHSIKLPATSRPCYVEAPFLTLIPQQKEIVQNAL